MRILYLSCHSVLEYDEITLFRDLGHYVFSPGAYVEPKNPGDAALRPGLLDLQYDKEDIETWHKLGVPGKDTKECISKEFFDRFDVVIIMHLPRWIHANWENMKHKPVVWRTIGQSIDHVEKELSNYRANNMKIVRYSPRESLIRNYLGSDAVIRFYKRPDEFSDWVGDDPIVINFTQSMPERAKFCGLESLEAFTRGFNRAIYGPNNEGISFNGGRLTYDELKNRMRTARVYCYTGTYPASYTLNFIEAFMTGIPIVAVGPKRGNAWFINEGLYEVNELLVNGRTGFVTDDPEMARYYIRRLLLDHEYAKRISAQARESAVQIFGYETIKKQWGMFLSKLV